MGMLVLAAWAGRGASITQQPLAKRTALIWTALQHDPGRASAMATEQLHPLQDEWNILMTDRMMHAQTEAPEAQQQRGKHTREQWEGQLSRIGGFSTVEDMLHVFSYLLSPSEYPASKRIVDKIFYPEQAENEPEATAYDGTTADLNVDINVFRAGIRPIWEDKMNEGGGRWVLRLRKGVADRVFEEMIFSLCGGYFPASDKINGVVLKVRKDDDQLYLWSNASASSKQNKALVKYSITEVLRPLLSPTAMSNLHIEYKAHPTANGAPGTQHPPHRKPGAFSQFRSHNSRSYFSKDREHTNREFPKPPRSKFFSSERP